MAPTRSSRSSSTSSSSSSKGGRKPPIPTPPRNPTSRPYPGRKARLFLAPISLAYLSMFALAMSLVLLLSNLAQQVADTKSNLNTTCGGVESVASFAASVPHYSAEIANKATVKTVNGTLALTSVMINLIIDIAKGYVAYAITSLNTPYVCLAEFVIRAALELLIEAAKVIGAAVDLAAEGLVDGIKAAVTVANGLIGTINKLGGHVQSISVDTSGIADGVDKYFQPASWMTTLNNTVPTLGQAEKAVEALFDAPAEVVRTLATQAIAKTRSGLSDSMFPIPNTTKITFCNGMNVSFVDDVGDSVRRWAIYGLEGLAVAAILLALILIAIEYVEYKLMYALVDRIRLGWFPDNDPGSANPTTERLLGFLQAADHPFIVVVLSSAYGAAIWFVTYITTPSALLFLFVGLVGIGIIQLQLWLLSGKVRSQASAHISAGLDDLVQDIGTKLNSSLGATSKKYADEVNAKLTDIQTDVNTNVFGWIQKSVNGLNDTIENFVQDIEDFITKFFAVAGPWGDLVENLVKCVLGTEMSVVEDVLTWVKSHSAITIPLIDSNKFLLSSSQVDQVTAGLTGSTADGQSSVDALVDQFITRYESVLRMQQYVFFGYVGVWVIVFIFGVIGLTCAEASLEWRAIQWDRVKYNWGVLTGMGGSRRKG
ncbi:hypothetical protein T439DRAFT_360916 [Meredithblackwellia eburnea MCA 4105]